MKSKQLDRNGREEKVFAVVFDEGDEFVEGLTTFAKQQEIDAASFTAVGAFQQATLGYFDVDKNEYKKIPIHEQVEVLSLQGNVAFNEKDGDPKVHAHVVVGKSDGTTMGGHVLDAHVRPTLEIVLTETPAHMRRQTDAKTGLALINLSA